MNNLPDETTVPTEQLIQHILPLCCEGEVEFQTSDEVREKIDWGDLADPSNVKDIEVTEERVIVHSSLQSTTSEKVASRTHWQPAEYRNHDVDVYVMFVLKWPTDGDQYTLPETNTVVEQAEYPTAPNYTEYDPMEHG
jgi:hypothetical protein